MKRKLVLLLIILTIMGSLPMNALASYAIVVGSNDDGNRVVTNVKYSVNHTGFTLLEGYIEIEGTNLEDVGVLFEKSGQGLVTMGERVLNTNTLVKYNLTKDESEAFIGKIRVGGQSINLNTATFPNLQSSNKQTININDPKPYTIEFYGNYLDSVNTGGNITGTYGNGLSSTTLGTDDSNGGHTLTVTNATNPGRLGYQNIVLNQTVTSADPINGAPNIQIEYTYTSAFRIIENLGINDLKMFPNTGAKGDDVYFTGTNFSDTRNYEVYFLKSLDGSDKYTTLNKATFVSLGIDVNGTEDRLTVKVPSGDTFERRNYYVVLTDVQNGQVIAEQVVYRDDPPTVLDEFTVIETGYKPTIEAIYPAKGPDTGGNVQISGRNIVTLNIPDLTSTGTFSAPTSENNDEVLVIDYADGTYKGNNVSIKRKINVNIAKKTIFAKDALGAFQVTKGIPDSIIVTTSVIDDAETDPFKDVVVELETTLTITDAGPNFGKQYIFNQIVTKGDGYEFEPSTYTPDIQSVSPTQIQIEDTTSAYSRVKNNTLLSIKGDKFLVDRVVDANGDIITRKPSVLIKKNDDNTSYSRYQVGFFPNETWVDPTPGSTIKVTGIIKYKVTESDPEQVLLDANGIAVPLTLTVINSAGNVVDGTNTNQIGQKILIMIPNTTLIADGGIKHLQVTNPMRDSDEPGKANIKSDYIEFIKTADIPVIESVKPNIITVEGNEEILITGSNLQDGLKLYLDGEPITTFTRELDTTGNKILITFTAPKGREGTTQLQVVNPGGGIAVSDFTYVKTFNKNPVLTSFTPKMGTYDTMVVINGDNFLKPDPTAITESGIDAYRLIGTRVKIDGREVNDYNLNAYGNIEYLPFTVPSENILIDQDAGKAVFSSFSENTKILNANDLTVAALTNDASKNPAIQWNGERYAFKYAGGVYSAYNSSDTLIGVATITFDGNDQTTIAIAGGPTFIATMNNNIVRVGKNPDGVDFAYLSDYAENVILTDGLEHFTLSYNFSELPIITNGKDKTYTITTDGLGNINAEDAFGNKKTVTTNNAGLVLNGVQLDMLTPYKTNPVTGAIEGNRTRILSKNQVVFTVPYLTTGKGYKSLEVVNPDTKLAGKYNQEGFYYIAQASSNPVITTIVPNKGSVDGGFYVQISGSGFEDNVKVYIDSVEVPTADTYVALDGTWIKIKMPASIKKLNEDYGVDQLAVPVVVVNPDGGNDFREKGFTYIIPQSDPQIDTIVPTSGSSNGGEIVEIIGYEFRFYEPYEDQVGGPGYNVGDPFEDIYYNNKWDDLLSASVDPNAITAYPELTNPYYAEYYKSVILPKVYFGENEANIVEYSKGYLKVITPAHDSGIVEVYVINNDSGVSNKIKYTYEASSPTIAKISPNFGRKQGQEPKDIYGTKLYRSILYGYADNDATQTKLLSNVNALVRFGDIDNREIDRTLPNSGLINSQRTSVNLDGGLTVAYNGDADELKLTVTENNVIYTKTFSYSDALVYVPLNMLQNAAGEYYVPHGLKNIDATTYQTNPYEYIRVEISDRRLIVERGYSPKVVYDNDTHVVAYSPSYYTIDTVPVTYQNPDGGKTTVQFTYTNPASEPKIYNVEPQQISPDETKWIVESSVNGGIDIEIAGLDFRNNVEVYIGSTKATVKEKTTKTINGTVYDLLVVTVPAGTTNDIGMEYPIMIKNEDQGLANSNNLPDLIGPNYGNNTIPFYFVYRKPLSDPRIDLIAPAKTSIHGGNTITITGSDFREGAYVIIGTRAGIPIYDTVVSEQGTKLTFVTPTNMTLGSKTVQVLNKDYGIAIKTDGIKVVSMPTLEPYFMDENGVILTRINVTGDQTLTLKGANFQEGASVYFAGTYTQITSTTTGVAETETGIFTNDKKYYVKEGYKSASVTFVDANTLTVKVPEVTFEGAISIVVMNPDNGITNDALKSEYTVPIPSDPMNLRVTTVSKTYIKLYDYTAKNVEYYEIYVYMGDKTDQELISNKYGDFKYLGVTNIEPYKIPDLPGFNEIREKDRIVFVIRAVNKFGPSGYSNLADLKYKDIQDIDELGPPDIDGGIEVHEGKDYDVNLSETELKVTFNATKINSVVNVDATENLTRDIKIKKISVPENLVKTNFSNITVDFGKRIYRFTPVTLNTLTFKTLADYYEAYAQITEDVTMDQNSAYLKPNIRGKKQISDVVHIQFAAVSNESIKSFDLLSQSMDVTMVYEDTFLNMAQESQIKIYKYSHAKNSYEPIEGLLDTDKNYVTARITQAGHYVLMTNY
ncbi:IPT/TIG domain-containing protein [Fusibacter sp. 3D3]|uniref:IPT/TIG domain-containing protein n=1 Tax=Fusibacter sp. 3D3 TaxID=1048380 RepID=UPI0008588FFB|nr:IPT/TIG domain-containing protein [Fusibacter sp. 3D3]GAU77808.1 hypothetical protein F3D3_2437 [Fusibacter sp. 3D3]